jgi:hypothetical protein
VGSTPGFLADPVLDDCWLQATATEALMRIGGVGRFHLREGRQVRVTPAGDVAASLLTAWLEGPVAAMVLVQQRRFALHASTVRLGGRLVAVAGASGAGKSTTVTLLARRGHAIVTDEVTAVDLGPAGGGATVAASARRLRLRPAALVNLGMDVGSGEAIADVDKRTFPIVASPGSRALGLVVALRVGPADAAPTVRPLTGLAAVEALLADTLRPRFCALQREAYLRWVTTVASRVPVVRLDRPARGWTGEAVAAAIEDAAGSAFAR